MPTLPLSLGLLVACCIVTVALGSPFVALLRHYGVGKRIRIDGPPTEVGDARLAESRPGRA